MYSGFCIRLSLDSMFHYLGPVHMSPVNRAGFRVPRSRLTYCFYINLRFGSYEKRASPVCRDLA